MEVRTCVILVISETELPFLEPKYENSCMEKQVEICCRKHPRSGTCPFNNVMILFWINWTLPEYGLHWWWQESLD